MVGDSHIKWVFKYENQEAKTVAQVDLLVNPFWACLCFQSGSEP